MQKASNQLQPSGWVTLHIPVIGVEPAIEGKRCLDPPMKAGILCMPERIMP